MDRTDRGDRTRRRAPADRDREPIYAELVAQWSAQGRTVPAEPEARWAASPARTGDGPERG
ncbi:hypothetical protein AQJ66_33355 [Streptomyces bungoensis]|uniref:Uncharacterized protein n=1 Tax=Streptomyces bungoensis TaxID=285568 RepID=A0A117R906_9ACTN|nr:hypothetical protein AQJ66_33355 [Streptomyces bungoensis]